MRLLNKIKDYASTLLPHLGRNMQVNSAPSGSYFNKWQLCLILIEYYHAADAGDRYAFDQDPEYSVP